MMLQVDRDHYFNSSYDSKGRFISYWYQINEIIKSNPKRVLEIGIGNGFVSSYLKDRGVNVVTLDIDARLKPDVVGSVLYIPFSDESYDLIACYEVLEHLPYSSFVRAIKELFRVSKSHVIISLPDASRAYRFNLQIPRIGEIRKLVPLPRMRRPKHYFNGEHYWEIGKDNYTIEKIISDINGGGFEIEYTFRVFEHPYHRFIKLVKMGVR